MTLVSDARGGKPKSGGGDAGDTARVREPVRQSPVTHQSRVRTGFIPEIKESAADDLFQQCRIGQLPVCGIRRQGLRLLPACRGQGTRGQSGGCQRGLADKGQNFATSGVPVRLQTRGSVEPPDEWAYTFTNISGLSQFVKVFVESANIFLTLVMGKSSWLPC